MARIPLSVVPDTQVVSTPPSDYESISSSPADFGGLPAQAEQRVGQEGEQAGNSLTQIAIEQQSRFNQIAGDNAMNQFMDRGEKLTYGTPGDPNNPGLYNLKGSKALEMGPQIQSSLGQLRGQIKDGLQNDAQKLQFDEQSRRYFQYKSAEISRHLSNQADVFGRMTNDAAIEVAAQHAGNTYTDDGAIAASLSDAANAATKNVGLATIGPDGTPGKLDPNILASQKTAAYGKIVQRSVMGALAADPNGGGAIRGQQILDEFGGLIDPDLREALTNHVKGAGEQAGAAGAIENIWATPPGTSAPSSAAPTGPVAPKSSGVIAKAIQGQEGSRADQVSGKGAAGQMQVTQPFFTQYARPGEQFSNEDDRFTVGRRGIDALTQKYNGDADRVAVAYFSGESNVAPPGSPTPWLVNKNDGPGGVGGTSVSQYVAGVRSRAGLNNPVFAAAPQTIAPASGGQPVPTTGATSTPGADLSAPGGVSFVGDSAAQGAGGVQPGATATLTGGAAPQQGAIAGSAHIPQVFGFEEQKMAQAEQEAARLYPNNLGLQKKITDGIWEKIQRRNLLEQKYNADVEKQRREASQQIQSNAILSLTTDPTKFDPSVLGQKDQAGNFILNPAEQENVYRFAHEQMKEHGIDDTAPYGPGYSKAYANIFAQPDDPNKINDLNDILKRGGPGGDLSGLGVKKLADIFTASRKNPDQLAVNHTESAMLQYAKGKLSFEQDLGPIKIRDPKGEAIFNAQFVPKFEAGLSAAAATGDPTKVWDYLKQENVDKIMQGLRSPADMAKDRLLASGQLTPADVEKPGTPLPAPPVIQIQGKPATPVDPLSWRDVMGTVPVAESGQPFTHAAWATYLTRLLQNPDEKTIGYFDQHFGQQGFSGADLVKRLTTHHSVAAPAAAGPSVTSPELAPFSAVP